MGHESIHAAAVGCFCFLQERIVCGLKVQGLFLKRQTEVSAQFAEITANEILTSQAMWEV